MDIAKALKQIAKLQATKENIKKQTNNAKLQALKAEKKQLAAKLKVTKEAIKQNTKTKQLKQIDIQIDSIREQLPVDIKPIINIKTSKRTGTGNGNLWEKTPDRAKEQMVIKNKKTREELAINFQLFKEHKHTKITNMIHNYFGFPDESCIAKNQAHELQKIFDKKIA